MESEQPKVLIENNMNLTNTVGESNNIVLEDNKIAPEESNNTIVTTSQNKYESSTDNRQGPHNPITSDPSDSDTDSIDIDNSKSFRKRHKKGLILDDSDDEVLFDNALSEEISNSEEQEQTHDLTELETTALSEKPKKHKRITVCDSDSELEMDVITPHNKSFEDMSCKGKDGCAEPIVHTTNNKGEIVPEVEASVQKSRLAMLCDDDSEDESFPARRSDSPLILDEEITEQTLPSKGKRKKSRQKPETENPKKMTAKEAAEQRMEIQSESQRMTREKNVSLPYHKPKTHSLKEFLARRPKLSSAAVLTARAPPSVAIKMTNEQLELISKKINEREKELKEFYKSESESDHDDNDGDSDKDYVPTNENVETAAGSVENGEEPSDVAQIVKDVDTTTDIVGLQCEQSVSNIDAEKESNLAGFSAVVAKDLVDQPHEDMEASSATNQIDLARDVQEDCERNIFKDNPTQHDKTSPLLSEEKPDAINKSTESYEFNLEDEFTEAMTKQSDETNTNFEEKEKPPQSSDFAFTELDKEIENFGNSEETVLEVEPVKSKLELLKERLANVQPRLSGGPDEIIDLNSGVTKPTEVVQLMERFAKHVTKKKHQSKHKVKLSIVTVESGGDIHQEEVAMNVDSDDDAVDVEEKPGAKLQKLKEELQKQMELKKTELWQEKAAKGLRGGVENAEVDEYDENVILDDDEEEAEMTEEDEEEEEEIIENDVEMTDEPPNKLAFLDQGAEVSDDEGSASSTKDGYEDVENNEEENEDDEEQNEEEEEDDKEQEADSNMNSLVHDFQEPLVDSGGKKVLKRIIKPIDDSDEEDDLFNNSVLQKSSINVHLDSTVTADEDEIPSHQPRQLQTPIRPAMSQAKSISDFLTPISFITSIQNLNSASKSIKAGTAISPFRMPSGLQTSSVEIKQAPQKKLFTDSPVTESQGSLDATQQSSVNYNQDSAILSLQQTISDGNDEPPNTQDLLGICSGQFTGVTQLEASENTMEVISFGNSQSSQLTRLGHDDMIISQLLDEEELENFKKKFESPINPVSQVGLAVEADEIQGGGVIDSDDDDGEDGGQKVKKKNRKRIQFSDESSDEETENNEKIDLEDKDNTDEEDIDNVGYDSEENEIDLKGEGEGKPEKLKLADFLENEAELSESEWGSEDEDEKDLDELEFEAGDTEKFDEEKVRADLEKIHMRRMLDDDTREVKLLQELLLEDGEMHGTGRQRQFKWKNINLDEVPEEGKKDDDDVYLDEEESEEQWRKKRHEREMFLKQKSQSLDTEEDLLCTSQLLKMGQKLLQRSLSHNSQNSTPTEKTSTEVESPFKSFSLQYKRGSFLNRNDQVLQRVAQYTKVSESVLDNSKKTTKHFLFQSISMAEGAMELTENKKRKATDGTPNVIKKLRLNTTLSPALKNKIEKSERAKKLFNF